VRYLNIRPGMSELKSRPTAAALLALGIVFGDIGTSPLYAFRIALGDTGDPIGVASLAFWVLIISVTIKYVLVVTHADNHGEGGILSLAALALAKGGRNCPRALVVSVGLIGAALLAADAMITPAISVLSAMEGLREISPKLSHWILPISVMILIALFMAQSRGTERIGRAFGPIMLLWFTVIGLLGLISLAQTPEVLWALDPRRGLSLLFSNPWGAPVLIGAVFLTVTGGEALYADMGHVGRFAIRNAWLAVVLPGLSLNYFGQAALVLRNPAEAANPFYGLVPDALLAPMIILAAAATVIAGQAVISGLFSLSRQLVALGWWPRLGVVHTSYTGFGQIYVPAVNTALFIGAITLTLSFGDSEKLAGAYGLAVSGTMLSTTILLTVVIRRHWGWRPLYAIVAIAPIAIMDISFFGANLAKMLEGGWIPAMIAGVLLLISFIWLSGRQAATTAISDEAMTAGSHSLLSNGQAPLRVPGTAVFLTRATQGVPPLLVRHVHANGSLHETVVLMTVSIMPVPRIPARERLTVGDTDGENNALQPAADPVNPGFWRVRVQYGFMQTPNLPVVLRELESLGLPVDPDNAIFFLGHATILSRDDASWWSTFRTRVYGFLGRNAAEPSDQFNLPPDRTAEIGFRITI
jgi:KUP system potassium uptake protein